MTSNLIAAGAVAGTFAGLFSGFGTFAWRLFLAIRVYRRTNWSGITLEPQPRRKAPAGTGVAKRWVAWQFAWFRARISVSSSAKPRQP